MLSYPTLPYPIHLPLQLLTPRICTFSQCTVQHPTNEYHVIQYDANQHIQTTTTISSQYRQTIYSINAIIKFKPISYMTNKQSLSPVLDLNVGVIENEAVQFTSVLRKRRVKMNRHKLKKRRKKQRFLTRKATK